MAKRIEGDLVRIAFERSKAVGKKSKVKQVFRPDRTHRCSIARTDGLECDEILDVAIDILDRSESYEEFHGWWEFKEDEVLEVVRNDGLTIVHDIDPPRHSHLVWPEAAKDRLVICNKLINACSRQAVFEPPVTESHRPSDPCACVKEVARPPSQGTDQ